MGLRQIFPWHTKRILVIVYTLRGTVFLSIAHFRFQVESYLQMGGGRDLLRQRYFAPPEPAYRPDVPQLVLERQLRLQDDHVLRPADGHGFGQHLRVVRVGAVKIPHSAQVSGREAGNVGIGAVQVFRSRHRRAFLRPAADQAANLAVQLHLGQLCSHQRVQRREQGAVISGLPDVHGLLLSGAARLIFETGREKRGNTFPRFSLPAYSVSCTISSYSRMCFLSIARLAW